MTKASYINSSYTVFWVDPLKPVSLTKGKGQINISGDIKN